MTDDFAESQVAGDESQQPPADPQAGAIDEGQADGTSGSERPPAEADRSELHRAYTQSQQSVQATNRALGLTRNATQQDRDAAITKLQSAVTGRERLDSADTPPELQERYRAVEEREWRAAKAIHGDLADHARAIAEMIRTGQIVEVSDIADEFAAAVVKAQGQAPATGGAAPQGGQARTGAGIAAGEAPLRRTTGPVDLSDLPRTPEAQLTAYERIRRAAGRL